LTVVAGAATAAAVVAVGAEPEPMVAADASDGVATAAIAAAENAIARACFRAGAGMDRRLNVKIWVFLFKPPTGLADGFGRERSPYRAVQRGFTPRGLGPRLRPGRCGTGSNSAGRCRREVRGCPATSGVNHIQQKFRQKTACW
jgi:hypothetical protein